MRGRAHRPAPGSPGPADPLTVSSPWSLTRAHVPKAARSMELSPETLTEAGCHPQGRGAVAAGESRPHPQFHPAPGSRVLGAWLGPRVTPHPVCHPGKRVLALRRAETTGGVLVTQRMAAPSPALWSASAAPSRGQRPRPEVASPWGPCPAHWSRRSHPRAESAPAVRVPQARGGLVGHTGRGESGDSSVLQMRRSPRQGCANPQPSQRVSALSPSRDSCSRTIHPAALAGRGRSFKRTGWALLFWGRTALPWKMTHLGPKVC